MNRHERSRKEEKAKAMPTCNERTDRSIAVLGERIEILRNAKKPILYAHTADLLDQPVRITALSDEAARIRGEVDDGRRRARLAELEPITAEIEALEEAVTAMRALRLIAGDRKGSSRTGRGTSATCGSPALRVIREWADPQT